MDVRIGVTHAKEIELELSDDVDRDQIVKQIESAVNDGDGMLWLTDRKGRKVGVPAGKVAYVELSPAHEDRRVGFGTV